MWTRWPYKFRSRCWVSGLILGIGSMSIAVAEPSDSDAWQYDAAVYLWAASIGGNTTSGGDIDITFKDILDNLDMTFMGIFGARKGKWALAADVIYLNLEADNHGLINLPIGPGISVPTKTNVRMESWVVTPTVRYRVIENEKGSLNLLAGARYFWLDVRLKAKDQGPLQTRKPEIEDTGSVWDGIVGVNGQIHLGEKWYLPYYLDVGAGQSDLTWQGFAGVGYHFKRVDGILGYRYLYWDLDDNDVLDDLNLKGPILGVKFEF